MDAAAAATVPVFPYRWPRAWPLAAALLSTCAALPAHQVNLHQARLDPLQVQGQPGTPGRAAANHSECARFERLGLFKQAEDDFARYSGGLSSAQQAAYDEYCGMETSACMSLLIEDGRLFVRHFRPNSMSRLQSTLHALYRVAQRFGPLPDTELVVDANDHALGVDLPVMVLSRKRGNPKRVLYPDFTFFSFPESVCPPEPSHAYGYLLDRYAELARSEEADAEAAWAAKQGTLFWRGSHSGDRKEDVRALASVPGADVQLTAYNFTASIATGGLNGGCLGLLETCRYKYLAYLEGSTYSSSLKYKLLCGSCVFGHLQYAEWWTGLLKPGEDYVEVREDWADTAQKLEEIRALPDQGRAMAQRSRQKVMDILTEDAVDCYWLRLIELSAQVVRPPSVASLGPAVRPIEDVLLYPPNVVMDGREVREGEA